MLTLEKVVAGIGSAGANCYKDIYKASRNCMTDRAMTVRSAASKVHLYSYAGCPRCPINPIIEAFVNVEFVLYFLEKHPMNPII